MQHMQASQTGTETNQWKDLDFEMNRIQLTVMFVISELTSFIKKKHFKVSLLWNHNNETKKKHLTII